MNNNQYTAAASFEDADGNTWTVRFDYAARAALKTTFGIRPAEAISNALAALNDDDVSLFCRVLAIGLQRHHPGTTAEQVEAMSPPLVAAVAAVNNSLLWSMHGSGGPPSEEGERPPEAPACR